MCHRDFADRGARAAHRLQRWQFIRQPQRILGYDDPTLSSWRPVLEGELARRARGLVDEIAPRLAGRCDEPSLSGAAGRALLFELLDDSDAVDAQLDAALEVVDELPPTLFAGIAGVAFVLAQLGHDVDESVDEGLAASLRPERHFDLVSGAVGLGVYALENAPASTPLLVRVIGLLEAKATRAPVGRHVKSAPEYMGAALRALQPGGAIDLGVAHGQAGAIAIAGAAAALDVAGARTLYEDLVAYLWTQALPDGDARFPAIAGAGEATRSAWCYGDPGIAAAIFAGASAARDDANRERALELARFSTRRALVATQADIAQLCHGAHGLGHIYNRLAQASGDRELAAAARTWFERALALPLPERLDLFEGQLGIALTLHAATTSDEPVWDRAFAVTVRDSDTI